MVYNFFKNRTGSTLFNFFRWYSEGHYSNNQQVKVWIEGLGEVDFDELVYFLG